MNTDINTLTIRPETHRDYKDMDYNGKEVFANPNNGCARIVENIGEVCYEIPLIDRNVYAS